MKKHRSTIVKLIVSLLVLAALAGGGWYGWGKYKAYKTAKGAAAQNSDFVTIKRGDVEVKFGDTGEISSLDIADVLSKASGRITEMFVSEGVNVSQGDRLAVVQAGRSEAEKFVPMTLTAAIGGLVMRCPTQNDTGKDVQFMRVGDMVSGSYDSGNPTCIMRIADMRRLVMNMKINEIDILKLKPGMPVTVTVDAMPNQTFPGKVHMISPQAEKGQNGENSARIFRVKVLLGKAHPSLRVGMSAAAEAVLDKRTNVLLLPLSALFEDKGMAFVFKKVADSKPQKIAVKIGLRSDTDAEILSGIKEGDVLYTVKPVGEVDDLTKKDEKDVKASSGTVKK